MEKERNRPKQEAEIPISSMIDIIFLLIIFFVVTTSIDKEIEDEAVRLAKAPHGMPEAKDPRTFVINIHQDGAVNIGGKTVSMGTLSDMLSSAASVHGPEMPIVIRSDKDAYHGDIQKVMQSVTRTKLYRIKFKALK